MVSLSCENLHKQFQKSYTASSLLSHAMIYDDQKMHQKARISSQHGKPILMI